MKYISILAACLLLFSSCFRDECTSTQRFVQYNPVTVTNQEFRKNEIKTYPKGGLENPGKIYLYKNMLLVNEAGRGIHFYDISKPESPEQIVYYDIIGNFDMAIQDDKLYVDNVIDLIQIDIKDVLKPKLIKRVENYKKGYDAPNATHVAYYTKSNQVRTMDCSQFNGNGNVFFGNNRLFATLDSGNPNVFSSSGASPTTGTGGSTARFTIIDNLLYTVNEFKLTALQIPDLKSVGERQMGWGIETIFPFKDKILIGSNTGMYIFDAVPNGVPQLLSEFTHARACDPVVANDDRAYVTLRSGNNCAGTNNQLDIIDITNLARPRLIKTVPMKNPRGLALFGDKLFICEGDAGLKLVNIAEDSGNTISFDTGIPAQDIILLSVQTAMVISSQGFTMVDIRDAKKLKVLSSIPIIN
jgi:hypothetical protein